MKSVRRVAVLGASRGVGRALCELLAREGHRVTPMGRDEGALAALSSTLGVPYARCDLRDEGSLRAAAATHEALDALVVCAALADDASSRALDEAPGVLDAVLDVNVAGALRAIRAFHPALARARGRVLLASSWASEAPRARMVAYASAKAAVETMVRALARDDPDDRVTYAAVRLEPVATEMTRARMGADEFAALPDRSRAARSLARALELDASSVAARVLDGAALARGAEADEALVGPQLAGASGRPERARVCGVALDRHDERAFGLRFLDRFEGVLGPSPSVATALARFARHPGLGQYPDEDDEALTGALAFTHDVPQRCVFAGPGSAAVLDHAVQTFTQRGDVAVCVRPTWTGFERIARARGLVLRPVPVSVVGGRAQPPLRALLEASRGARLLYLASPANPTGAALDADFAAEILEQIDRAVTVVFDEAYGECVTRSGALDARAYVRAARDEGPRVLVLRSMSKMYALAGFRVGCALTDEGSARLLRRGALPYAVGRVSAVVATEALRDRAHLERARAVLEVERRRLGDALRAMGCTVLDSDACFVLADLRVANERFVAECEARDRVVPRGEFLGEMRMQLVPVGRRNDTEALLDALRAARG